MLISKKTISIYFVYFAGFTLYYKILYGLDMWTFKMHKEYMHKGNLNCLQPMQKKTFINYREWS